MTDREAISDEIETIFLDAGAERGAELKGTELSWEWLQDASGSAAFDRMCAAVTPGSASWARVESDLSYMAEDYPDCIDEEREAEIGESPSAEDLGRWLFSRAATVPATGSPVDVGEWVHAGTGQHRGVTFTAFIALGVAEHLGMALRTDADGDWAIPFCPV